MQQRPIDKSGSRRNHAAGVRRPGWRAGTACALAFMLAWQPRPAAGWCAQSPAPPLSTEVFQAMQEALQQPYLDLFERADSLRFTPAQIEAMRKYLDRARDSCVRLYRQRAAGYQKERERTQAELKRRTASLEDPERRQIHCKIQNARILESQAQMLAEHAIPVAYENKKAKLELIEKWPEELKRIRAEIASGAYHQRRFGDVKDIGVRELVPGQERDVKDGQEAVRQLKMTGLLPPELDNAAIRKYVTDLAHKIGARSDLRVPLNVTVLNSKEINAFALPGGFLFVQRGLLEAVEDEAQLAGVIAHEIAHVTGRHGYKLMKRATIASIIYQAAQLAAVLLTGGAATLGTYYALQYGFYGLGLVLSLDLLGVSREFELEADQLGVQYAWNAGYDPSGFIRFFDRMATREGYVNGASWFRTHPPFYARMVQTRREMMFLPEKPGLIRDSDEFKRFKAELAKVTAQAQEEEKNKPSLLAPVQGCPAPEKIEYKPGQPIETICSPSGS